MTMRVLGRLWRIVRRCAVPTIQRGNDPSLWCGRYLIVSAPPAISQLFGCGEIGLELYRRIERRGSRFNKSLWRRMMVRAAPTCTLWKPDFGMDAWRFSLRPKWIITRIEMVEVG